MAEAAMASIEGSVNATPVVDMIQATASEVSSEGLDLANNVDSLATGVEAGTVNFDTGLNSLVETPDSLPDTENEGMLDSDAEKEDKNNSDDSEETNKDEKEEKDDDEKKKDEKKKDEEKKEEEKKLSDKEVLEKMKQLAEKRQQRFNLQQGIDAINNKGNSMTNEDKISRGKFTSQIIGLDSEISVLEAELKSYSAQASPLTQIAVAAMLAGSIALPMIKQASDAAA